MGFDSSSFMKHKFSARTEVVLVPTLSQFFDVGRVSFGLCVELKYPVVAKQPMCWVGQL